MTPTERDRLAHQLAAAFEEAVHDPSTHDPLAPLAAALPKLEPPEPAVGQVWRLTRQAEHAMPALAALTHVSDVLRGVLAIPEAWLASHEDLIVPPHASPTGEELLLAAWSDTPVPKRALAGFVGTLPSEVMNPLLMLLQHRLTGGFKLRAIGTLDNDGLGAVQWQIQPLDRPEQAQAFTTGTRASRQEDGRLVVREALATATAGLAADVRTEVWERGGAEEPVPSHVRTARSLWAALRDAATQTTNQLAFFRGVGAVSIPGAGLVSNIAAVRSAGRLATEDDPAVDDEGDGPPGPALPAAIRPSDSSGETAALSQLSAIAGPGVFAVGDATVEIVAELAPGVLSLRAFVTRGGEPVTGFKVRLRFINAGVKRRGRTVKTARDGIALIANVPLPEGEVFELIFGEGPEQRVFRVQ